MNLSGSGIKGLQTGQSRSNGESQGRRLSLGFDQLEVAASPFHCLDAPVHLKLQASDVQLTTREHKSGRSFSIDLNDGRLSIEIDRNDLERLVLKVADETLRSEGINVAAVKLDFETLGTRVLKIQSRLTAKKGFVTAMLEARGLLTVNESLQARLEDFQLRGEGVIAKLVAGYLRPRLETILRQDLALGISVLGCLSLTDIEFHASETLRIIGRFGAIRPTTHATANRDSHRSNKTLISPKQRQFHVYIIDTGWNKETRRLLDESRTRYAAHLQRHVVCELTPGQSEELLRSHPELVGADPILLAIDRAAAAEKRTSGLGFRYNMGAVADRVQAQRMLRKLLEILGEQQQVADITAAIRRHARKEGFRGTLDVLNGTITGFGGN
jgi:hypothetical protein